MSRHSPQVSDDEAKRLWQRAAELQDEAEREAARRSLTSFPAETRLSLEHVTQAAEGAGIHPDYVLVAMAEQQLPDAREIRRQGWRARWLRRTVSEADAIEVSRLVGSSPIAVASAVRSTAVQPPFNMLLENTIGVADDAGDRVLVYRLQGGTSPFNSALNFADVRVLLITCRPVHEGTHVRIRAPLFRRGVNLGLAGAATTLVGVGGSWSGWTLGALVAGTLGITAGSVLLIPAGIGALAGGTLGLSGYRALYSGLVRDGQRAINNFLTAVALEAESRPTGTHSLQSPSLGDEGAL